MISLARNKVLFEILKLKFSVNGILFLTLCDVEYLSIRDIDLEVA